MSYCTTAELVLLTGSAKSDAILQAIIDDGDREIDAWLALYGLTGTASGACKSASLKMAQAGLLYYDLHAGDLQLDVGEYTSTLDVTRATEALRAAAFTLLEQYRNSQTSLSSPRMVHVRKVEGRF